MINDTKLLLNLTNSLNNSIPIITSIISLDKNTFSKNEKLITISVGLINEISEYTINLSNDLCFVNKNLYQTLRTITAYGQNLFDNKNLLNTYKLYDCLKLDVINLINYLNHLRK